MKRLDLDDLGALRTCGYPERSMMIGGLILIKVLVCRIMATSNTSQLIQQLTNSLMPPQSQQGPKFNLKVLASLLYYIIVEYMETLLAVKGYSEDLIWTCGLRSILYRHTELKMFYKNENYRFRCEHFALLEQFLKALSTKVTVGSSGGLGTQMMNAMRRQVRF